MVLFDQLRISEDGKKLYINLHVNTADYFDNIYLDSLTIMTADKVLEATDAGSPTSDYIYKKTFSGEVKTADIVLTVADFSEALLNTNTNGTPKNSSKPTALVSFDHPDFTQDLFFVYVKVKGIPDECTPCSLDKEITVGVTFDTSLFYQLVMNYTRQLASDCTIPQGFTDLILLWNAFKAAVDTEHWIPAINFYNQIFGNGGMKVVGNVDATGSVKVRGCGCR